LKISPVILSEVVISRSEISTQSKDPYSLYSGTRPRKGFSSGASSVSARTALGIAILLLAPHAFSQTLTGTVKNSTTGKPAAGDEVILLKIGQGMEESGQTKADAKGQFSFKLDDAQSPHLVRVIHQDVTYHRMAPPGTTSVEIEVYDAAKKVEGVSVVADIMRFEAQQGKLVVVREFGVQNTSKPPRTQMNERNLEFYIPDGAQIIPDSATAVTEGGNPLKTAPVPEGEKDRYSFIFPLRPGLTRFEVAYQQAYTGNANINPKSIYSLDHFVVMTPKAMQFTAAATASGFKLINYPAEPDASVQVASNTKPGENLSFKVAGEGTLQAPAEGNSGQNSGGQGSIGGEQSEGPAAQTSRPGGGLGPPIDAPDPLQKYRWWILGGCAAVLVIGGVFVAFRQQVAARAARQGLTSSTRVRALDVEDDYEPVGFAARADSSSARPSSRLLDALKEELFQLEVERKQGQLSQSEYETAKAALDQTLERALKREAQKA
jgi:hypothetical protein